MKKLLLCLLSSFSLIAITSCSQSPKLPDNPMIFEQKINEEYGYAYLTFEDKVYVPYCPYERNYLGNCVGYYLLPSDEYTSGGKIYIYEFKGFSVDEWIIEFDADGGKDGAILREINATNIPSGLESSHEWNK